MFLFYLVVEKPWIQKVQGFSLADKYYNPNWLTAVGKNHIITIGKEVSFQSKFIPPAPSVILHWGHFFGCQNLLKIADNRCFFQQSTIY